jgi:hypothetical protein
MTPYHVVYDPVLDCYFVTEVGTISYADATQLLELLRCDQNYHRASRILSDVRRARLEMSPEERQDVFSRLVPAPQARVAVVVTPGVQYGAYQQVKVAFPQVTIEIFTDLAEARRWLKLPAEENWTPAATAVLVPPVVPDP